MAKFEQVFLQTVDIADKVNTFVEAYQKLKVAKTAQAVKAAKASMAAAIADVATTIASLFKIDPRAANAASLAINTTYLIHEIASVTASSIATSFLTIAGLEAGIVMCLAAFLSKPPRIAWTGRVHIYFSEKYPYTFGVKVKTIHSESGLELSKQVFDLIIEEVIKPVNEALSKLPKEDVDFVLKFAPRPPKYIDIKVGPMQEKHPQDKIVKEISTGVVRVAHTLRDCAQMLAYLHFLAKLGAKTLIQEEALNRLPQIAYQVEGLWRKELEKLAIKLMERREYTRQIKAVMLACSNKAVIRAGNKYPNKLSNCWNFTIDPFLIKYGQQLCSNCLRKVPSTGCISFGWGGHGAGTCWIGSCCISHYRPEYCADAWWWAAWYIKQPYTFTVVPKIIQNKLKLKIDKVTPIFHIPERKRKYAGYGCSNIIANWLRGFFNACLEFTNELLSEIHPEAARYIAKKVGTTSFYMDIRTSNWPKAHKPSLYEPWRYKVTPRFRTNFPEQINAKMKEIIDLYVKWQKGYAEE